MARKPDIQRLFDSLVSQIGSQVARNVADAIARSGLTRSIKIISRGLKRSPDTKKGRRPGRPRSKAKACSVRGCKQPARAKGLCSKHYQKKRYNQMKKKPKKAPKAKKSAKRARPAGPAAGKSAACRVKGCGKKVYARGLCSRHFMAWVRSRKK